VDSCSKLEQHSTLSRAILLIYKGFCRFRNHHQTGFSPAGANQRGPLAATLSGPGGEGQSAVARLTGEKKNHPSTLKTSAMCY